MRAALLSCGPSLSAFTTRDAFDVVIAVNKAVTLPGAGVTWWSVGDVLTVGRLYPTLPYAPLIWTHTETMRQVIGRFGWVDGKTYHRDEINARWSMFSATAGLMLAKELGAERVECFGCDMTGEQNWDGTEEPTANRTEQRWERERVIWEKTRNLVEEFGVEVVRHGFASSPVA
jgi:hypothetical protein